MSVAFSFARVERTLLSAALDLGIDLDLGLDLELVYAPITNHSLPSSRWTRWYSGNLRGEAALRILEQS